jgi:hypothetical protein
MMQSQTDHLEIINDTTQFNKVDPLHVDAVIECKTYDLNTCDTTVWVGETGVHITSDVVTESATRRKTPARHYFKWTDNEIDQLYREVQLKNYTIQEMAVRHQRTNSSILFKLKEEKLIQWDCSLDNTNMRTVLRYYNEFLRNYQVIEEEDYYDDEEELEEDLEEDEDYVPGDTSEEEEEEEEEKDDIYTSIHKDLLRVNKYKPDIFDKLAFAYLDIIYFTVLFTSNAISYVYRTIYRC